MREPRQYEAPLCAEVDGDLWFPEQGGNLGHVLLAKRICGECTHRIECAEWGIHNERHGIWGGITSRERESIRARRGIRVRREESA